MPGKDSLDALLTAVAASPKYHSVCPDLVRRIGAREWAPRAELKQAIKATKNKLHQVGAAYFPGAAAYARWEAELSQTLQSADPGSLRRVCAGIMGQHASTRERLPLLDTLFAIVLRDIAPLRSVLDVACGFNPLAIPWMPLAEGATYYAWDIYSDLMRFLQSFMDRIGVRGVAEARDVLAVESTPPVQVAYLLKAIPCLEQIEKEAGLRLLDAIQAEHLLVSFPVYSLGGRDKRMMVTYDGHFRELVSGKGWTVQRFVYDTELLFLVSK